MMPILINNWLRIIKRSSQVCVLISLAGLALMFALYLSQQVPTIGRFAILGKTASISKEVRGQLSLTEVTDEPPRSAFVQGQYDGFIQVEGPGEYTVSMPFNPQSAASVQQLLMKNKVSESLAPERSQLSQIVGFVMMFLLMGSFTYSLLFGEDKETQLLQRICVTPLPIWRYMLGQAVFIFSWLVGPTSLLLIIINFFSSVQLEQSLWVYIGFISLIALLGVSFALLLMSVIGSSDTANMVGSATLIVTSLLAGSFLPVSNKPSLLGWLSKLLPQKFILDSCEQVATGHASLSIGPISVVLGISCGFFIAATYFTTKSVLK